MNEALPLAAAPPAPAIRRLTFLGAGAPLFSIFLRNLLLSVVTLGIYYFWGKVRARRYILGSVDFEGDRFAYHATGKELLFGWVKVAAFFAVIFGLQNGLPLLWKSLWAQLTASIVTPLLFLLVFPLAVVGARRFRLSRTSWRGIRFSFRGRARDFLRLHLSGTLLSGLTFGLYYAYFQNNIRRFLITRSFFGSTPFGYDGDGQDLLGIYVLAGIVLFGGFLALGVGVAGVLALFMAAPAVPLVQVLVAAALAALIMAGLLALFWAWFLAVRHRYIWGHTTVGTARFRSTVTARKFLRLFAGDAVRLIPTLGLALPFVVVRHIRFTFANLTLEGPLDVAAIHQEAQTASATGESLGEFFGIFDLDLGL